jgi:murein DD-endopeptidase MepM/ murein hydrolase activator NlpD
VYFRLTALLFLAGALAAAATGASTPAEPPVVSATAHAVSVVVPGQPPSAAAVSSAPGAGTAAAADGFAYPADGSLVRTGALSSSAAALATGAVGAQGVADVLTLSLFNGEITAEAAAARATSSTAAADAAGSAVTNLVVLGAPVSTAVNQRVQLGDWGYLVVLEQVAEAPVADGKRTARGAVNALHLVLTADHGGQPAGTEVIVGHAEAVTSSTVEAPPPPPPVTTTTTTTTGPKPDRPAKPKPRVPLPKPPERGTGRKPGVVRQPPQDVSAPLSPHGYVFPVYGASSFTDTFGSARAGVVWHHGEDIFAPLGAPVLAVADGTVFSVGWNELGGYRLWLRDRQGNQFYYAHLSAYSPLAQDGREVKGGAVLGFVGNTGDAQGTPYHLHFEIHPVGLLPMGYDGVVNAFPYLSAWRRLQDISFAAGRGWAPPVPANATAPRPGALLLGSTDISSASGLEPGSLERALLAPLSAQG